MTRNKSNLFSDDAIVQESVELKRFIRRTNAPAVLVEDDRTGMSKETLTRAITDHLKCSLGTDQAHATPLDVYKALSFAVRDRLMHRWIRSRYAIEEAQGRLVCYLSAEFLLGRQLGSNLLNINCFKPAREALSDLGFSIYDVLEQEAEPGLGNGGLGRLAACFLDSLASLNIPAFGYGIRYEFGIFEQEIQNGWQVERPDKWLRFGTPWELPRPQLTVDVKFGGYTEAYDAGGGRKKWRWIPSSTVQGIPFDTMIPGFRTDMVNTLRLWAAGTSRDFDFQIFNEGDYVRAVADKTLSENISKVLYPNDMTPQGRELRLKQQYFFVSCSLQDIIRRHLRLRGGDLRTLHDATIIQLNDTHPTIAIPELMRLLVDVHDFEWDDAWDIVSGLFGYTNHTLLSEALERWPVSLLSSLLPRHMEIIFEINRRFLERIKLSYPGDDGKLQRLSIIEEGPDKKVRMAHLATVASKRVNGVAKLHTDLLRRDLLRDFAELWPEKFFNVTNGITPRRWLMLCNPKIAYLITERIGRNWIQDLSELKALERFAEDPAFGEVWQLFRGENKADLAEYIKHYNNISVNPDSLFDVQVKRLHEYKRQLLNILYIAALYRRMKEDSSFDVPPRTVIFGAKAAPGYFMAKLIIKLINAVGEVVNNDPAVRDRLKVVFLKNFCVSLGERVYPAADLSEQISLAGKEASGTGNMKFALNGALTIGTYDGANIEIREAVGPENFFLFGLRVEDIERLRSTGYNPRAFYDQSEMLRLAIDTIADGTFSGGDREIFRPIVDSLLGCDEYMLCADFDSYFRCQQEVNAIFGDTRRWTKMSILTVSRMGYFSSDRAIEDYLRELWHVNSIGIKL